MKKRLKNVSVTLIILEREFNVNTRDNNYLISILEIIVAIDAGVDSWFLFGNGLFILILG